MASKNFHVPGDLVLVKFPGCGYWPCQVTAIAKHGRREVKCFGEDSTGTAFPNCMVYYDQTNEEKYISKASFKTYPHLAEALKQIQTCAGVLNKTKENRNYKQKKRRPKGILKEACIGNSDKTDIGAKYEIKCQNGNREEASPNVELVEDVEESPPDVGLPHEMAHRDSEIACVGVTGSVGFIKKMALGEKEMIKSVKMESVSGVEGMENSSSQWGKAVKREIEEATGAGIDMDATGTRNNDDELDYKMKVELDSDVDDFGADETGAIEAESQNKTNPNVQPSSSAAINENSLATEASCEDDSSRGSEVNHPGLELDLPASSHEGGEQEKSNEVVQVTMTCEMPTHVFTKFAPIFMDAASHSKAPTVVKINPR